MEKPKKRSVLRMFVGQLYFRMKRRLSWIFSKTKYAKKLERQFMPFVVSSHKSLLLRKLKNVDMWLQQNKITNLQIAMQKLDGVIVHPGETFSFWRLVGTTTKRKGYLKGMVLTNGTFKPGTGGGLCQMSNLIYWITLHSPLTVTERYRHSYDVFPDSNRTQPFGSGATVSYNYIDLQIYNDTDRPYQLHLFHDGEYLYGEWRSNIKPIYSYQIYEKKHWITQEYWGGYIRHNLIYRKIFNPDNELIDDEYITENHAIMMYQPLLENQNIG